ncbi:MAG: exodeoxyribonuclease VII small subunit [Chloroflexota bacterium]
MSKQSSPKPVEELTYEEAFTELESIVAALEGEQGALEEAMAAFERGQTLVRRCGVLLEQAELKIRKLSADGLEEFEAEE